MDNKENLWLLQNRLSRIFNVITQYGEENFYIAFSGGKDSTVLSYLIDKALPDNKIPRVYIDTGIELNMIKDFVLSKQLKDNRITIVKPTKNIKETLETKGYPFKSKGHSELVARFQKHNEHTKSTSVYCGLNEKKWSPQQSCPKKLLYQFSNDFNIPISDNCCLELKEKPILKWSKENNKTINIVGVRREEGGRRITSKCTVFNNDKLTKFQPLVEVTGEWLDWVISYYNIEICDIYKPPFNFDRTGCKGCPFNVHLQEELDVLESLLPNEKKQCEIIWKPIYEEYRRINYRLKGENND